MTRHANVVCLAILLAFLILPATGLSDNESPGKDAETTTATALADTCYFQGDFFPQYTCLNQAVDIHFWAETCDLLPDCYDSTRIILKMFIKERDLVSDDNVIQHNKYFPTDGLITGVPFDHTIPDIVLSNWIVGDGGSEEGEFFIVVISDCLAEDMFLGSYRYAEIVHLINESAPAAPNLVSPIHGATNVAQPVTLDWDDVSGAVEYHVQVDDYFEFETPDIDEVTTESEYEVYGLLPETRYYWRVQTRSLCPWGEWSTSYRDFTTDDQTEVVEVESPGLPEKFQMSQNYPNPFNPDTRIEFAIPRSSHVKIDIYNIVGAHVRTLVDEYMTAGYKSVTFDSKDNSGSTLSSGIYVYRIAAEDFTDSKKMILLK